MISEEGVLSPLSFGNSEGPLSPLPSAIRRRGTPSPQRDASELLAHTVRTTPTLYSAQSLSTVYPSAYPSDVYTYDAVSATPSASPPLPYKPYMYGSWIPPSTVLDPAREAALSVESRANAVRFEAERQRHILQLERELAEEQRQQLAARLSSHTSATRSPASIAPCRSPSTDSFDCSAQDCAVEASPSPTLGPRNEELAEELRAFSAEALAPPSSPSPPSAHLQARRRVRESYSDVGELSAGGEGYARSQQDGVLLHSFPSSSLPATGASARDWDGEDAVSLPQRLSQKTSPPNSAPPSCGLTEETRPSSSAEERCVSAHMSGAGVSLPSPTLLAVHTREPNSPRRLAPPPPFYKDDTAVTSSSSYPTRGPLHREACSTQGEDERLYDAYRQKLARIREALNLSSGAGVLLEQASIEARRAHQRRGPLTTPDFSPSAPLALRSRPTPPPPPPGPSDEPMETFNSKVSPLLTNHRHPSAKLSLVQRTPLSGSCTDTAPTFPRGYVRRLRWDLAHSGNIALSSDGRICRADATDALALMENEYKGRLVEMLHRLVIPFYALGTHGVARGCLFFAFHWMSPLTKRNTFAPQPRGQKGDAQAHRVPALAFGFATRSFTGYGTEAPAFLYHSTGAIAQGVRSSTSSDAEIPYGVPFAPGVELAARLDLELRQLEFFVQGVSMGVAFRFVPARHPAPLFPVVLFSSEMDGAELLCPI